MIRTQEFILSLSVLSLLAFLLSFFLSSFQFFLSVFSFFPSTGSPALWELPNFLVGQSTFEHIIIALNEHFIALT